MAAPHVFAVWTILDAKGAKSVTKMNFPINVDIGVLQTFVSTTAELIDALIHGRIVDAGIGLAVDLSGATLKATPDVTSDVEEGARFSWSTAVGSNTTFRLPTFNEAFLLPGTRFVDQADTDVDAFVQRVLQGQTVALVNVSPSDDRGEDIEALNSARESFTSSRN